MACAVMGRPKKLLLLSDPGSAHTIKWARGISSRNIEVVIFGLSSFDPDVYSGYNIQVRSCFLSKEIFHSGLKKIIYLKYIPKLLKIITEFKPDIVHAHYATSYGLLGMLTGFHPLIVSVWGDDVYDFVRKTVMHRMLFKHILKKADVILSTGNIMAQETKKYTDKMITVTPFGIDLNIFSPKPRTKSPDSLTIGIVKSLEKIYGFEILFRAFKILIDKKIGMDLNLLLVGGGTQYNQLKSLAEELGIARYVKFYGPVNHDGVVKLHNQMDIEVYPSTRESFGVSIIEASACGNPVVVSNVGGLPEVVEKKVTGFIVEKNDYIAFSNAILLLINNDKLRDEMGKAGRKRVIKYYDFEKNLDGMIKIYYNVLRYSEK